MKKVLFLSAVILLARFATGCGILGGGKTYDGSEAYSEAHPEQTQLPSYMDPDHDYSNDSQ
jgi:hypothetical protein